MQTQNQPNPNGGNANFQQNVQAHPTPAQAKSELEKGEECAGVRVQRLVLPLFSLKEFEDLFYETSAIKSAGEDVYKTAESLIPELYRLFRSRAVEVVL